MSFSLIGNSLPSCIPSSFNTQSNHSEAFIELAKKGNTEKILELIKHGIDINTTYCHGNTALMEAIYNYKIDTALALIENRADLNIKQNHFSFGKSALIIATERNLENIVIVLIEKGAEIDIKDNNGWTALMHAARSGNIDIAKILIAKGAHIEIKEKTHASGFMSTGEYGKNALMIAAQNGHANIVIALIEKGANLEQKNEDGDTALTLCIKSYPQILFLRASYIQTAQILIANGANINIGNNRGETPLILAKQSRIAEIVQMLKAKGAIKYLKNTGAETGAEIDWMDID